MIKSKLLLINKKYIFGFDEQIKMNFGQKLNKQCCILLFILKILITEFIKKRLYIKINLIFIIYSIKFFIVFGFY
jgi:hypothetical protein